MGRRGGDMVYSGPTRPGWRPTNRRDITTTDVLPDDITLHAKYYFNKKELRNHQKFNKIYALKINMTENCHKEII